MSATTYERHSSEESWKQSPLDHRAKSLRLTQIFSFSFLFRMTYLKCISNIFNLIFTFSLIKTPKHLRCKLCTSCVVCLMKLLKSFEFNGAVWDERHPENRSLTTFSAVMCREQRKHFGRKVTENRCKKSVLKQKLPEPSSTAITILSTSLFRISPSAFTLNAKHFGFVFAVNKFPTS